jgi:hypothetical protein
MELLYVGSGGDAAPIHMLDECNRFVYVTLEPNFTYLHYNEKQWGYRFSVPTTFLNEILEQLNGWTLSNDINDLPWIITNEYNDRELIVYHSTNINEHIYDNTKLINDIKNINTIYDQGWSVNKHAIKLIKDNCTIYTHYHDSVCRGDIYTYDSIIKPQAQYDEQTQTYVLYMFSDISEILDYFTSCSDELYNPWIHILTQIQNNGEYYINGKRFIIYEESTDDYTDDETDDEDE